MPATLRRPFPNPPFLLIGATRRQVTRFGLDPAQCLCSRSFRRSSALLRTQPWAAVVVVFQALGGEDPAARCQMLSGLTGTPLIVLIEAGRLLPATAAARLGARQICCYEQAIDGLLARVLERVQTTTAQVPAKADRPRAWHRSVQTQEPAPLTIN